MKSIFSILAARNYYTAKAFWKWKQRQAMEAYGGQPIINYQMGKVGSSSVQASLEALRLDQPVYHVHFLNPTRVRQIEQQRRKYYQTERYGSLKRPWLSEFLYEEIQKKDRHWQLITLVREPVARNISTFFENLEVTQKTDNAGYAVRSDYYSLDIEVKTEELEPLIQLFFDRVVHERPLRYFDDEIKTVFGIDVFDTEFPKEKGYSIYQGDNADLLLIRLENLNLCAATAFKEFLGVDNFSLLSANESSNKVYAPLYRAFKNSIRLPPDYKDRMYDSQFSRHFYGDDEIREFRQSWA